MKKYSFLLLITCTIACTHSGQKQNNDVHKHAPLPLGEVTQQQLSSSINLPATLKPYEITDIYPKVNGYVNVVYVDRGSQVKKGQLLILLDAPEIDQQYYAAKSKYLQGMAIYLGSKDNYKRMLVTAKTPGTIALNDIEQAKSKMLADSAIAESEMSDYKALEADRNYLSVTAPFDGVITERDINPGALVGPNLKADDKPMLVLQQEGHLRLVIDIPEEYTNQLGDNTPVSFHVDAIPGKVFQTTISRQAGALNMKYRLEAVEADVYTTDGSLKPGMYAEVEIPVKRTGTSFVVPKSAIVTSTEKKYVICVKNGVTHWIDIKEGNTRNDSTEVFGNFTPHDKIILHATDEIKDNMPF